MPRCGSIRPWLAAAPATDVADLLARAAAEDPDRLAIVESGGRRVTWGELEDEVGRLATGLGAAGIVAGHRVMIALGNRIEFVTTYLAVLRAQAVAVPVNPTSQAGELARMIADSGLPDGGRGRRHGDRGPRRGARARGGAGHRVPGRLDRGRPAGPAGDPAGRRGRRHPAAGRAVLRPPARRLARAPYRRSRTRRSWPRSSTRAVRRAARAPRCSPTARCSPTSSRSPRSSRR